MRSKILTLILTAALLLSALPLASCRKEPESFTTYSFDLFDTVTSITGYAEDRTAFLDMADRIIEELTEYHKLYTTYHRFEGMENLCTINELTDGAHRTVQVDRRIIDLLLYAKEMYRVTGGKVNIAMGSVLSIWHDYREMGMNDPAAAKLPPMEKLTEAALHTDMDCLVIDEANSTVTVTDPAVRLDVGAVAKGYAVEMVARSLEEQGISGYVLNVGGNIRTVGPKGTGLPWVVGIENPAEEDAEPYLAYLNLSRMSLVTSGSYQRYYVVDGKRYHHIIDPDTLLPAEGYTSVSVVTKSSADGDALSTALFCMTLEEGMALVESLPETEAMWVTADGELHVSDGFAAYTDP